MKVAVLGATGMLGEMVVRVLSRSADIEVMGFNRTHWDVQPETFNRTCETLSKLLGSEYDYVINCLGATKPYFSGDATIPMFVNGIMPHQLAQWAELSGSTKIIHITTDCVYSGANGPYDEDSRADAEDLYGKSKSLGEPANCMVIRTSIIGPEFGGNSRHFLSWVKSQHEKSVMGFANHMWNGLTTLELSFLLSEVLAGGIYRNGTFHCHSSDVSKYDMVRIVGEAYGLNIDLARTEAPTAVDRRLRSNRNLFKGMDINGFRAMIQELVEWEELEKLCDPDYSG